VNKLYCPQCGEHLKHSKQLFCDYCGADLRIKIEPSLKIASNLEIVKLGKDSKKQLALGLFSLLIAIPSIIIGLILILQWRIEVDLYFSGGFPVSVDYFKTKFIDESLDFLSDFIGIIFILLSVLGLLCALYILKLRKKFTHYDILSKINHVLAIVGIIADIMGIIIGLILVLLPQFTGFLFTLRLNSPGMYF
jgi:hypothetical protein